jgi:hypothetical protein
MRWEQMAPCFYRETEAENPILLTEYSAIPPVHRLVFWLDGSQKFLRPKPS